MEQSCSNSAVSRSSERTWKNKGKDMQPGHVLVSLTGLLPISLAVQMSDHESPPCVKCTTRTSHPRHCNDKTGCQTSLQCWHSSVEIVLYAQDYMFVSVKERGGIAGSLPHGSGCKISGEGGRWSGIHRERFAYR